jgi:hypothetical protein
MWARWFAWFDVHVKQAPADGSPSNGARPVVVPDTDLREDSPREDSPREDTPRGDTPRGDTLRGARRPER